MMTCTECEQLTPYALALAAIARRADARPAHALDYIGSLRNSPVLSKLWAAVNECKTRQDVAALALSIAEGSRSKDISFARHKPAYLEAPQAKSGSVLPVILLADSEHYRAVHRYMWVPDATMPYDASIPNCHVADVYVSHKTEDKPVIYHITAATHADFVSIVRSIARHRNHQTPVEVVK